MNIDAFSDIAMLFSYLRYNNRESIKRKNAISLVTATSAIAQFSE